MEVKEHTRKCQLNPNMEMSCPYKELGCDDEYPLNIMDRHLTENMIGHQMLMLVQLSLLRERLANKSRRKGVLWVVLTAAVIAIAAAVAIAQFIDIQTKMQETQSNLQHTQTILAETKTFLAGTKLSLAKTKSSLAKTKSSLADTKSSLAETKSELEASLEETQMNLRMTNTQLEVVLESIIFNPRYITKYIEKIDKVLSGIEFVINKENNDSYEQTFYLNKCRLRLTVESIDNNELWYYMERLNGKYDDVVKSCRLQYISVTSEGLLDILNEALDSDKINIELEVGIRQRICTRRADWHLIVTRVYFDIYTEYRKGESSGFGEDGL